MSLDEGGAFDQATARRLVARAREAGVARTPPITWTNVAPPSPEELAELVRLIIAALEGSPVPKAEWPSLSRVFDAEQLSRLLGISLSSLRRYQSGSRETPDAIAERLHFLALVVADLAGSYNEIGIRRWFERPRTALGGKPPASLLAGEWHAEGVGAQKVRQLAKSLVAFSAT
jgi:uncharacterized protein (DUF2384 family)